VSGLAQHIIALGLGNLRAILVCWSSMKDKIPSVVKCDQCGRLSPIEGWDLVYEDRLPLETVSTPQQVKEIDCQIRCNKCGIRIQTMLPPRT
jgi:hypothetical protein